MKCVRCKKERKIWSKELCKPCYMYYWKKTKRGKEVEGRYMKSEKRKEANKRNSKKFREKNGQSYFNDKKKIWRKKYPEKHCAYNCKWLKTEAGKNWLKKWQNTTNGKAFRKRRDHARRTLKKEVFTSKEWIDLLKMTKGVCPCCKNYIGEEKLTLDHIIPISKGGANTIKNVQPLCFTCNAKKGVKTKKFI